MKTRPVRIPTYISDKINNKRGNLTFPQYFELILSGANFPTISGEPIEVNQK